MQRIAMSIIGIIIAGLLWIAGILWLSRQIRSVPYESSDKGGDQP